VQLDPWLLPDDWTPDQAVTVAEFLIALHDAIWDSYGWMIRDGLSDSPLNVPSTQLELPLQETGDPRF